MSLKGKAKVSVTVGARLLEEVDRIAGDGGRSAIFEAALESWLRSRRKAALDDEVEQYYRALSAAEQLEDRSWAETGDAMGAESGDTYGRRSR